MLFKSAIMTGVDSFLSKALDLIVPRLFPVAEISRDGNPYLFRYYPHKDDDVVGWYLHKFVDGDGRTEVHSHPWDWSIAILLTSGYFEIRYKSFSPFVDGEKVELQDRGGIFHAPFTLNVLQSHDLHRVMLVGGRPAWTIFIHGPRVRNWAFVNEATGICRVITRRTRDRVVPPKKMKI